MGVGYSRTLTTGDIPVFQIGKAIELAQGGFALDTTGLVADSYIKKGQPMQYDEATRVAKPLHTAKIYENAASNATSYKVVKDGNLLVVGDYLAKSKGGSAYAITAIDKSNAAYDLITVGTTIGAVTAGDFVFASTATGATAAAFPSLKGLLYADAKVASGESVSVAIHITAYARRVPYSADIEAALPRIIYSQSF